MNVCALAGRMMTTTTAWRAVGGATLDEDAPECAWGRRGRQRQTRHREAWLSRQPTPVQQETRGVARGAARVAESTSAMTLIPSCSQCKCSTSTAAAVCVRSGDGGPSRCSRMFKSQWLPWVASWALHLARAAAAQGATLSMIVEILLPDAEDIKVQSEAECVRAAGPQSRAAGGRM